jgi:hypothetical protein
VRLHVLWEQLSSSFRFVRDRRGFMVACLSSEAHGHSTVWRSCSSTWVGSRPCVGVWFETLCRGILLEVFFFFFFFFFFFGLYII